jgi:hypothetical protein
LLASAAIAAAVGAALALGYVSPPVAVAVASIVAFGIACISLSSQAVLAVAIVALAAASVNSLPGPPLHGGKPVYVMVAMVPVLYWGGRRHLARVPMWLWLLCSALFVAWLVGILRAYALGAPSAPTLRLAASFGILPLLLPAYVAVFYDDTLRRALLVGLTLLAVWVASVNSAASLGVIPGVGGYLAHGYRSTPMGGLFRLYALSAEIPIAAIPFCLGSIFLARRRRMRHLAIIVLALCVVAVLLSFTRAAYVGLAVMLALMIVFWAWRQLPRIAALATLVLVVALAATAFSPLRKPLNEITARAGSIFGSSSGVTSVTPSGNTLSVRFNADATIRASLSTSDWSFGYGFLPSPWYSFPQSPTDSLLDSDLGWYNALTTMGLVGVALIFLTVVGVLGACWRARAGQSDFTWLAFGGMAYAIYAISVSQTLVTLFSAGGSAVAACALGLGLAGALRARDRAALPVCHVGAPRA